MKAGASQTVLLSGFSLMGAYSVNFTHIDLLFTLSLFKTKLFYVGAAVIQSCKMTCNVFTLSLKAIKWVIPI